MKPVLHSRLIAAVTVAGTALLASCGPPPPPAPAPAPPPVVVIPPRPQPPVGAAPNLTIPELNAYGIRQTVNTGVSQPQALWNLRSAYNVAALNCVAAQYAPILEGYKSFLKVHDKALDRANAALDKDFRAKFGKRAIRERETYQTQVYNYFALPPVKAAFCNSAMQLASEINMLPAGQLDGFAYTGLQKFETPFLDFFNSYEQYRADLSAWQARYEPQPVAISAPVYGVPAGTPGARPITLPET